MASLLVLLPVLVGCSEAYLTQRMYGYFGGTVRNVPVALHGIPSYIAYIIESGCYDLLFYGTAFLFLSGGVRGLRWNALQRLYAASGLVLGTVAAILGVRWQLYDYFKSHFDLAILRELTAGNLSYLVAVVFDARQVARVVAFILAGTILLLPLRLLRGRDRSLVAWAPSRAAKALFGLAWAALFLNHLALVPYEPLRFGLSNKISYWTLDTLFAAATDFDRDGFGPLTVPRDPDNFDPLISPYALDVVGDGIDQDGLAGDLETLDAASLTAGFPPLRPRGRPKNVIVAVVETFRIDVVERPDIMPFLNSLVRAQAYNRDNYSNYGVTSRAIQAVFFGSLHYAAGSHSLFDEFRSAGYLTFGVSGQNEKWGNTDTALRFDRLDRFFDRRNRQWDPSTLTPFQRRNPEFGLVVDSAEVNRQAFSMIEQAAGRPFFMYVNYQDLHYPYFNEVMRKVLVDSFHDGPSFFRPENRQRIWLQYANAALHLDSSFRALFDFLVSKGLADNTVVVIVGDHPDSFYENGLAGHAWCLDEHQRRTPLIVVNGRGHYDSPTGQDELARLIVETVNGNSDQPLSFLRRSGKRVFELTGTLEKPRQLGWIDPDELMIYDFRTDRWQAGETRPAVRSKECSEGFALFKALINRWESERLVKASEANPGGSSTGR